MKKRKALVSLATGWGPRYGGINSFNFDFLRGFAAAFVEVKVICIVPYVTSSEIESARRNGVDLRSLPYKPEAEVLDETLAPAVAHHVCADLANDELLWVGHDVFTGSLANALAETFGGRAAIIHHMSYETYKSYESGSSVSAREKSKIQRKIFDKAQLRLAIGPMLRDELDDWYGKDSCGMLIPGLQEIEPIHSPSKWTAILFGRLNPETNRLKQTKLGIAALARCERDARTDAGLAKKLKDGTRIKMYGVDPGSEGELRLFVEQEAGSVLEIQTLPFSEDRVELFDQLRRSSVALMPSWHEGFGLVGWEAIAAGVPVILGKDSGLFRFLSEFFPGVGTGCVVTLDVRGSQREPYFQPEDLVILVDALKEMAADEDVARRRALNLRKLLGEFTPKRCAEDFARYVKWDELICTNLPPNIPVTGLHVVSQEIELLSIPAPSWQSSKGHSYSQLLRADEACVPFHHGNEDELRNLLAWTDARDFPLKIRLYTGTGGSGKTRLLIETCRRLSTSPGWHIGFLAPDITLAELRRRLNAELTENSKWFVVIDYAETRREQLATLVEVAQGLPLHSLRIVLLARDSGEWWERLPTDYLKCEQIFAGRATDIPRRVLPLHSDQEERTKAYRDALHAYAKRLGISELDRYLNLLPDLRDEHFGHPLYVQMAALLALHGERADSANGLTEAILRHEFRYWKALAQAEKVHGGERAVALVMTLSTLAGGLLTERDAWQSLERSSALLPEKNDFAKMFSALCPLYPGRQGLQPLRPDVLGEALVASGLMSQGAELLLDAVLGAGTTTTKREHALAVLARSVRSRPSLENSLGDAMQRHFTRIWQEIIKVGAETGSPTMEIACRAFTSLPNAAKVQVAGPILSELKASSINWDSLGLLAADTLVEQSKNRLARSSPSGRDAARVAHTDALKNRASARHYSADDAGALADAKEAVATIRQISTKSANDLSAYCWALNAASNRSHNLGQYVAAFEFATEAVAQSEKLLRPHDDKAAYRYAMILENLGRCHSYLGRYLESYQCTKTAVEITEPIALRSPDDHVPGYAVCISDLSIRCGELGQYEDEVNYSRKAVDLYRPLAAARPDRHMANYAAALVNLGAAYSGSGLHSDAFSAASESSALLQPLAESRPERFSKAFGGSLINLATCCASLGKFDDALKSAERSVAIFFRLRQAHPIVHQAEYAKALFVLALRHAELGAIQHALDCCYSARRELTEQNAARPGIHAGDTVNISCMTGLFEWLNSQQDNLKAIKAEEAALREYTIPNSRVENSYLLLFLEACVSATGPRRQTIELFHEILTMLKAAHRANYRRSTPFRAIAAEFLAEFDPLGFPADRVLTTREELLKQYPNDIPLWIKATLRKLKLNSEIFLT
jgi:glycosyltransferase involved in cell wall biosynthesis